MDSALAKIPAQERVKKTLNNFLQSKQIPHALLFSGPEGVGKDNTAIQFAKALAQSEGNFDADKARRMLEQLQEPYIKLVFPLPRGKNELDKSSPTEKLTQDELELVREQIELKSKNPFHKFSIPKANFIKINSIREIKKFLSMDFQEINHRIILISDAHLMNEESQNALLKSLEEPPEKVIIILTTPFATKLRSTIISRCWRIYFDPLDEEIIAEILVEYFKVDKTSAMEVAPFAAGSVHYALKLIDIDFHNLKEKTISILRYSLGRKFNSAFDELNSVLSDKFSETYPIIITMILTWLNDIQKHRLNTGRYFFKNHLDTLEKFNSKFPDADISEITTHLDRLSNLPRSNINNSLLAASLIFELAGVVLKKQ